jgi:hypothetical protein
MPTPSEAPAARSLADELADITLDDDDQGGAAPAADTEGAPPPTDQLAPADEELDLQEEQLEDPDQLPEVPVAWAPPEGGLPFKPRADGRDLEIPGALQYEHGVYIPADGLPVLQRHLADREQFTQRQQALERQVQERDPAHHPDVLRAQASLQALNQLLDKGPLEVAKWLDNFQQNRPLLQAQIENAALQAQLQARQQQTSQADYEQAVTQVQQALPGYLRQNIEAAVSQDPELKALAGMGEQLLQKLWAKAPALFFEADRDYPEYGLRQGQIIVRPDVLRAELHQLAQHAAEVKRLEAAARHNRAATGRAPAKPTVTTRGRPTPAGRSTAAKPQTVQEWRDSYLARDGDEDT